MSDLDVRSLGMVASRMLTNYIKTKEREQNERGDIPEDEEYFDPNYLEVISGLVSWGATMKLLQRSIPADTWIRKVVVMVPSIL